MFRLLIAALIVLGLAYYLLKGNAPAPEAQQALDAAKQIEQQALERVDQLNDALKAQSEKLEQAKDDTEAAADKQDDPPK